MAFGGRGGGRFLQLSYPLAGGLAGLLTGAPRCVSRPCEQKDGNKLLGEGSPAPACLGLTLLM